MKIHENFHVKGIFNHDNKSNRMNVYTHIYLVSMLFRFVELCSAKNHSTSAKNHFPFYLLHIYPSVDFLSKYLTASPEEMFLVDMNKPFSFSMLMKGIKSNHNNLLSFNY